MVSLFVERHLWEDTRITVWWGKSNSLKGHIWPVGRSLPTPGVDRELSVMSDGKVGQGCIAPQIGGVF